MPTADVYRAKAAQFLANAETETNPRLVLELQNLAHGYLRLADQADKNSHSDIVYESKT